MNQLDRLAPVALEDLVEEASLLARVDRKYVVPVAEAWSLLDAVPPGTRVLEIGGDREFGYRSRYLDTPDRAGYLSSGRSRRLRWKVRTRRYLDTGGCWLEVKTRGQRGQTVKQRVEHPETPWLTTEGRAFVAGIVGEAAAGSLQPVLETSYRRTTLLLPGSSARVTLDVDLAWSTADRELVRRELAIVETKTGSTPSAVDRLLWSRGHRPVRISKYGVGMAALHPELPRLKWHHTLARHLAVPTT
ncbi:polyphosphate polymerase domain-containing protein [Nocardioides sp.]|uniref:polyphosphate polymerase domain-containing protein n=1 Tax=Nocardioides sp. TaxID=35761 RepID=UPI0039E6D781